MGPRLGRKETQIKELESGRNRRPKTRLVGTIKRKSCKWGRSGQRGLVPLWLPNKEWTGVFPSLGEIFGPGCKLVEKAFDRVSIQHPHHLHLLTDRGLGSSSVWEHRFLRNWVRKVLFSYIIGRYSMLMRVTDL